MSEEFINKYDELNSSEQTPPAEESSAQEVTTADTDAASAFEEAAPVSQSDYPSYQDIYSDSKISDESSATSFESAVKEDTEDMSAADRVFTNPYTDPFSQPQQSYQGYSASQNDTPQGYAHPSQSESGYYHQSYVRTTPAQPSSNYAYHQPQHMYTAPPSGTAQKPQKAKLGAGAVALIMVLCLIVSGFAGFGGSMLAQSLNSSKIEAAGDTMVIHQVTAETTSADSSALVDKSTSQITEEVADSVVEITTEVMQTSSFYGQYIATGAGSGVIISEDGYIITNNHVIDGASSVKVTLHSGESYDATVIGADDVVDIALLKIDASGLTPAVFGDSDSLKVGDKTVVIGNPLGTLGGSVSEGIISALDRSIVIDGQTMHLLQTDAAINPGNSGGGTFNGQGELIGIVVAKSSSSSSGATIDNIGFVIPINNVVEILSDLKDNGYVTGRGDTGMNFVDLTNSMYSMYYYGNSTPGVYIYSINRNSNASSAGFQVGDRVISVNGTEVSSSSEIESIISALSAGDQVEFELERSGQTGKLTLTLEERRPDSSSTTTDNSRNEQDPFGGFFGN